MSDPQNPSPPEDEAPSAVSADYLRALSSSAAKDRAFQPVATAMPDIKFGSNGAGALDLTNTIQQIIEASSGVCALHLLTAAEYLLAESAERLKYTLKECGDPEDQTEQIARLRILADLSQVLHCQSVVSKVAHFPIASLLVDRLGSLPAKSVTNGAIARALVSEANLKSLGIEPADYYDWVDSKS
jgi:hypothetical protein